MIQWMIGNMVTTDIVVNLHNKLSDDRYILSDVLLLFDVNKVHASQIDTNC